MVGSAGNVETAVFLASLAERVTFKSCVLVGMAAGVPGEVSLGSVIIAERVLAYKFMLMTAEGPRYEPKPYSPNERHFRNMMTLDLTPAFRTQVRDLVFAHRSRFEGFPADELESLELWAGPKLKRGMLLAGGRLIEDGKLPEFAADINSRIVGAEMEGAGFAAACTELEVPWMVLRGVADYGEPERRRHWQWPATYSAACLLLEGTARGYLFAGVVGHGGPDRRRGA